MLLIKCGKINFLVGDSRHLPILVMWSCKEIPLEVTKIRTATTQEFLVSLMVLHCQFSGNLFRAVVAFEYTNASLDSNKTEDFE